MRQSIEAPSEDIDNGLGLQQPFLVKTRAPLKANSRESPGASHRRIPVTADVPSPLSATLDALLLGVVAGQSYYHMSTGASVGSAGAGPPQSSRSSLAMRGFGQITPHVVVLPFRRPQRKVAPLPPVQEAALQMLESEASAEEEVTLTAAFSSRAYPLLPAAVSVTAVPRTSIIDPAMELASCEIAVAHPIGEGRETPIPAVPPLPRADSICSSVAASESRDGLAPSASALAAKALRDLHVSTVAGLG